MPELEVPVKRTCNHIIGGTRNHQTAILAVEYFKVRFTDISFTYRENRKLTGEIDDYSIIVPLVEGVDFDKLEKWKGRPVDLVEVCRAFIVGRGEYWA